MPTQKELVLKHLEKEPITTQKAWRKYNITQLPVIIYRLREDGYPIRTIDQVAKNGAIYAKYVLPTGDTERCPHCGAIYDVAEIDDHDSEESWIDEGMLDCWHTCPCCGEVIEEEPRPNPAYIDPETRAEIEEHESREYREMIAELEREFWRSR